MGKHKHPGRRDIVDSICRKAGITRKHPGKDYLTKEELRSLSVCLDALPSRREPQQP